PGARGGPCPFLKETTRMIKSLVIKELREVRGLAVAAVVLYLVLLLSLVGVDLLDWGPNNGVPFVEGFCSWFIPISGLLAIALGFRQSLWELRQRTILFLLHRPISRDIVFVTKLATGLVVFLVLASLP